MIERIVFMLILILVILIALHHGLRKKHIPSPFDALTSGTNTTLSMPSCDVGEYLHYDDKAQKLICKKP